MLARIHTLRTHLVELRQQVVPLQESIYTLNMRGATEEASTGELALALRSLADELAELRDALDFHRDEVQRLTDLYLNGMFHPLASRSKFMP